MLLGEMLSNKNGRNELGRKGAFLLLGPDLCPRDTPSNV
jgi:hypothetical protein